MRWLACNTRGGIGSAEHHPDVHKTVHAMNCAMCYLYCAMLCCIYSIIIIIIRLSLFEVVPCNADERTFQTLPTRVGVFLVTLELAAGTLG